MTTQSNYSLQNFGMNNAKVLTGNSQPVPDFIFLHKLKIWLMRFLANAVFFQVPKVA